MNLLTTVFTLFLLLLSNSIVNASEINAEYNGRSFFEAYPETWIEGPSDLSNHAAQQDVIYISKLPVSLSAKNRLLIHRENIDPINRFFELIGSNKSKLPQTYAFLCYVTQISVPQILYLKKYYQRGRPLNIFPNLETPLDKPETASYPSGHAAQVHLSALYLNDLIADQEVQQKILTLASEISTRRTLALMNFPSDILAGQELAEKLKTVYDTYPQVNELRQAALNEVQQILTQIEVRSEILDIDENEVETQVLQFRKTGFQEFVARLQTVSNKSIILNTKQNFLVDADFTTQEWELALESIVKQHGLTLLEDENIILITENE